MSSTGSTQQNYQHGHHSSVVANHLKRSAEVDAAFVLPYLKPGMRLLDVGCGPGSITIGLARRVASGRAIGIDPSESVIETARELTKKEALSTLTFEVGDIFAPRFDAHSFDAIFAHQVLQHLSEPVRALLQMRRLLAPGGLLAVRDVDWGSTIYHPANRGLKRFLDIYYKLAERNGAQPNAGRCLRVWFREAGFEAVAVTTLTWSFCSNAATSEWSATWAARTLQSAFGEKAIEHGLATREELEAIADDWGVWGRDPDACWCFTNVEMVATAR